MGGDKITAKKVNFSKSLKVPRSLLSFLLLILRQCISIGWDVGWKVGQWMEMELARKDEI